jgi:iron complex outermembrane receptor protein
MHKAILIIIICICALTSYSQDYTTNDTISLKEVVCKDLPKHKYSVATVIHKVDSLSKEAHDNGNLADLLRSTMPIYINKRADSFSTISIRGTSANHTAILVNGINLNSLTLGHSNLANIDMFIFDNVEVLLGSSGALYGSDAIGGTINLNLDSKFTNGTKAEIRSDYSSLNNIFQGIKIYTGNKQFESKTKIYYTNNENRFKFTNHALHIISENSISHAREYTNNARKENYGVLQHFFYKPSLVNTFDIMLWYQNNWNQIQPSMGDNSNKSSYKKGHDQFIRILAGYNRLGESVSS